MCVQKPGFFEKFSLQSVKSQKTRFRGVRNARSETGFFRENFVTVGKISKNPVSLVLMGKS